MSKQDTCKIGWSAGTAHMMEGLVGKTKKQLRAEAVERLKEARYHSASDHLCAMLDWGHEPHTGEESREALIDLLTDDDGEEVVDTREHMDNGVSVQMCPNGSLQNLARHSKASQVFSDGFSDGQNKHETVRQDELSDTCEQLEADVCEWIDIATYKTFKPERMLEVMHHWLDRQAAITEREVEHDLMLAGRMAVEVERKRIAELTTECDALREQREHWFNEAVTIYRWFYPHDEYGIPQNIAEMVLAKVDELQATNKPNSQSDVLKTAETAENATSKDEIHDFDDSREKLEADIEKLCTGILAHRVEYQKEYCKLHGLQPDKNHSCWSETQWLYPVMMHLLDRQEAITRRETRQNWQDAPNVLDRSNLQIIAELTAERDKLKERVARFDSIRSIDGIANLLVQVEDLTAERDELRERLDAMKAVLDKWVKSTVGIEPPECSVAQFHPNDGDTREQLEADMERLIEDAMSYGWKQQPRISADAIELLDRQAEITKGKCYESEAWRLGITRDAIECGETVGIFGREYVPADLAKELTAERDKWKAAYLEKRDTAEHWHHKYVLLQDRRDELTAEVEKQRQRANDAERGALSDDWYVARDRYEDDVAALTTDAKRWADAANAQRLVAMEQANKVQELTAERDEWRARAEQVQESYLDAKDSRDNLQEAIDAMGNGQFYAMYRKVCAERDALKHDREKEELMEAKNGKA